MNIVFSTILESFAEIREDAQKLADQINNTCFICDIERNRFEIRANGNFLSFFLTLQRGN
jgi:hypothetical protein